ncbi:DUF4232 domain-containing protein [Streptomyces sp. H51]|uniref:DUF4232 domain-containing protein n=1 Tax=Streptomyces sp. H51 TaxID=3111770 RepID=UPI002D79006E|nr:DUF4232 domain-containing protein [Streptomyces sp. H51]
MRASRMTIAALAVVAGLSLTACQNDDAATDRNDSGASSAASAPSSANGGSSSGDSAQDQGTAKDSNQDQGTVAGTGSNRGGTVGKCRTDELEVTAKDATVGGDTDGTVAVEFTNGGGRDCAISGYAGVDLKTNAGSLSAERTGEQAPSVVLKDGQSVSFAVTYPVNDSGGSGVRITGLVVTPPDETKSVSLDWPGGASLPVTDGSGTPVKVGPIGSAGQGG